MFANLLPALKFAIPVGGLALMGGGVYFIGGIVPKKDPGKPLLGIYLLVKGTTAQTDHNKDLVTKSEDSNNQKKTTKNYFCQLGGDSVPKFQDKNCALYNLNRAVVTPAAAGVQAKSATQTPTAKPTTTVSNASIAIHADIFKKFNLTTAENSVTTTSFHILKVSQDFYDNLSKQTDNTNKTIKLVDSVAADKSFGSVQEVIKLNIKTETDLKDPRANLFLARIKSPTSNLSGTVTTPLSCKFGKEKPIKCNVYTLPTSDNKKNNLNKTKLTNLTAVGNLASNDFAVDNYVVVELPENTYRISELKNTPITINKSADTTTENNKIADAVFDQLLIGKVGTNLSSSSSTAESTIFPLTAKKAAYLVKKADGSDSNAFSGIISGNNRNYKCKYTVGDNVNYDDSCILQIVPDKTTGHKYEELTNKETTGFTEISSSDSSKDQFLVTLDSNKLYNLRPDWSKNTDVNIVIDIQKSAEPKTVSFNVLQELKHPKAIGKTDLVFVKYKATESVTNVPLAGKCALTEKDTTGVECTFNKATMNSSALGSIASASENPATFANDDHFAVKFGAFKNAKEFNGKEMYFYTSDTTNKKKITLEIIATMGGDIATGKSFYFLEPFRNKEAAATAPVVKKASI